ncbi:MAG TPA: prepilin-type N-terminal cleavage/methylation domain-containing protein, partial [Candidatus Sumerlaeota bacterium]|nr:prepilin-type N-terminal cleavage/methylation domain-containing protein [Candidatus Sumerlaeota bacterium]
MEKKTFNTIIKRRIAGKPPFIKGFSLLEVLVSVAILLAGIISIVNFFPLGLKAQYRAADLSRAALLANMKAEEIRRDCDKAGELLNAIRNLRG